MTRLNDQETEKALEKALDAIENATYNLNGGFILATANRAYYACFYCMTALLYTKGMYAKTHQGTRATFSEHFIKSAILPVESSDSIKMLLDYRQEADYSLEADISVEVANMLITKATEFYKLCNAYYQELLNS